MTEYFSVTYNGPALDEHRIPVTELAPSLIALSEMFMVAHRLTGDGVSPPPSLDVRANREGSFAVELVLDATNAAVDLFSQREVVATATGVTLLVPVVSALRYLRLVARLGRQHTTEELEPGLLRITWPDGTTFEGPPSAQRLADDMDFRRSARDTLAPVERREGIDSVTIRAEDPAIIEPITLDALYVRDLDVPPRDDEVFAESVREVALNPLKPSFEAEKKWYVSDGVSKFWVTMHDLDFSQRVVASVETFGAGDVLRCRMRTRQLRNSDGGLTAEHIIEEVLEHLRRPPADSIQFD